MNGFIKDISDADYHQLPGVSPSRAKYILVSPKLYQHRLSEPVAVTDEMNLGTAIHAMFFDTDLDVVEWSGNRAGKQWDEFERANLHALILPSKYYCQAVLAVQALHFAGGAAASALITSNATAPVAGIELAMRWTHGNGIECRGKIDSVTSRILDLKTTTDISDRAIIRTVVDRAYHMQLAAYRDGYRRLTGVELETALIFVQTIPPFDVRVVRVEGPELERGLELWNRCLDRIKECTDAGEWPGIATEETALVLPEWALGQVEELNLTLDGETI